MMSERPQWSAARRVPRSQGARGRLANVLRRVSHTRQSAAYRTAARAPFRRSAPSLEGDEERGAARCAKGSKKRPPGLAQRWLFDKVKKRSPVARMERSGMRERLLHSRGLWRVRSRISLRFIRATRIHKPRRHCPPGEAVYNPRRVNRTKEPEWRQVPRSASANS